MGQGGARRALVVRAGLVGALCLAPFGCAPSFDDIWEVKDLRVLAIQAEPPEVLLRDAPNILDRDTTTIAWPPVMVSALATDPRDPGREVDWQVWACTAEEREGCSTDAALRWPLRRDDGGDCVLAADLDRDGPAMRSALDNIGCRFTPSVEMVRASLEADPYQGFGGIPLTVEFRLLDGDNPPVRAYKRLVYTLPLDYSPIPAAKQANANPVIAGLLADDQALDLEVGLRATAGQAVVLLPVVSEGSKESYVVVEAKDPLQLAPGESPFTERTLEESLSYSYFVSAGALSHAETGGRPSPFFENKKIDDITTTWTAPAEGSGEATLWLVVRDDRGGVTWTSVPLTWVPTDGADAP